MKAFSRRITIVAIILLLGTWVVARASYREYHHEGGFKLGVDLAGGTILVYEVDEEKLNQQQQDNPNAKQFDPAEMQAFLKRRIDPVDLLNVTIRPGAGGKRFEIILPFGGSGQATVDENTWLELVHKIRTKPEWADRLKDANLDVPPGEQRELISRVYHALNWETLEQKLREKYPVLKDKPDLLKSVPEGDSQKLVDAIKGPTGATPEEMRKFIDDNGQAVPEKEVRDFVEANLPPTARKNVTAEEIEKIKDLIKQQGSLEFRIVANRQRDGAAFRAAEDYFKAKDNETKRKEELRRAAEAGLPPPAPVVNEGDTPFTYSWVEIGPKERHILGLNNKAKGQPRWEEAAKAREKGEPFIVEREAGGSRGESIQGQTSMMIWSRKCENLHLSPADRDEKTFEYYLLVRNPATPDQAITGGYLVNAQVSDTSLEGPAVDFTFNTAGGRLFGQVTSDNLPTGRQEAGQLQYSSLAILLDGAIVSAPTLNSAINERGQITGLGTGEEAKRLAQILRSGALPATLKGQPVSENTIGPTLGRDTVHKGVWSVGWAFAAVLVFMLVYYRFAGFVACVALLANLLLTVAFMVFVNASFTLPGLAGLVLTLGMAVDANVLIYERLREERERGASLTLALRNGYDRAFPTILDTHLTSIFTAIVLYAVGNDQLKGFGISLTAGLVISLFTSLYVTRLMFDLWQYLGWLKKLSMYQGLTNFLHRHYIDFMSVKNIWFTVTVALTVIGLAVFLIRGPKGLNIDFVGGTAYGGQLEKPLTIEQLRNLLETDKQEKRLAVRSAAQEGDNVRLFTVTYDDGASQLIQLANDPAPGVSREEREKVVKQRASVLPDWSVEQIFPKTAASEGNTGNASRYFTVRTTEKEANLVQVSVNRLLWEDNHSLLKRSDLEDIKIDGRHATLTFTQPASPGYLKQLIGLEFQRSNVVEPNAFDLHGTGASTEDGFKTMSLDVSSPLVDQAKLAEILARAKDTITLRPLPTRLENFDAQLAAETSRSALYAILASWSAILLYLWFRFGNWTFGAAAVLCLIHDLCFTLGAIAFCHYLVVSMPWLATLLGVEDFKIDLPAVAALLTLIGYSVNDTIVVFDRIREVRGKNPILTDKMINDGVNQTLTRTLLAAMTVWLVVIVLYCFGGEGVHLFAFVMVVGVLVGTYSSIYIASPLLLIFGEGTARGARPRVPSPTPERVAV